jgi:hypothetical protein
MVLANVVLLSCIPGQVTAAYGVQEKAFNVFGPGFEFRPQTGKAEGRLGGISFDLDDLQVVVG